MKMCFGQRSLQRSLRWICRSFLNMYVLTVVLCLQALLTSEASQRMYNQEEQHGLVKVSFRQLNGTQCQQLNNDSLVKSAIDHLLLQTKFQRAVIDNWRKPVLLQVSLENLFASSKIVHNLCARSSSQADIYHGEVLFVVTHQLAKMCKMLPSHHDGVIPATTVLLQLQGLSSDNLKEMFFGARNVTFATGVLDDLPIDDEDEYGSGSGFEDMGSSESELKTGGPTATSNLDRPTTGTLPLCKRNNNTKEKQFKKARRVLGSFYGCMMAKNSQNCKEKYGVRHCRPAAVTNQHPGETTTLCSTRHPSPTTTTTMVGNQAGQAPNGSNDGCQVRLLVSIVLPIFVLALANN